MEIPYTVTARPDTGLWNAKIGIWLFLASEVMLFGGLFSAYIFLRLDAEPGFWPHGLLNVPVGTMNTGILIASSVTVVLAWASLKMRQFGRYKFYMGITILCGIIFLFVKLYFEWPQKFDHFGAYIKPSAMEKYEKYLGNKHLLSEGLAPRVEITGHLHNHEALHDPKITDTRSASTPSTRTRPTRRWIGRTFSISRRRKRSPGLTKRMWNARRCSCLRTALFSRPISPSPGCTDCTCSAV